MQRRDEDEHVGVTCYIGLGSNMGNRRGHLESALAQLGRCDGVEIRQVSSFHETEPVGGPMQGRYLNGAAELRTTLAPEKLLDVLQRIENNLGRTRTVRWGPRTIDLDVLLYGDEVIDTERLTVPHPLMHERGFVLGPLSEIAPDVRHPVLQQRIGVLLQRLGEGEPSEGDDG